MDGGRERWWCPRLLPLEGVRLWWPWWCLLDFFDDFLEVAPEALPEVIPSFSSMKAVGDSVNYCTVATCKQINFRIDHHYLVIIKLSASEHARTSASIQPRAGNTRMRMRYAWRAPWLYGWRDHNSPRTISTATIPCTPCHVGFFQTICPDLV